MIERRDETEFHQFVDRWFTMAGRGQLEAACALLDGPNSYGSVWNAQSVNQQLAETFGPESIFMDKHPEGPRFTEPAALGPCPSSKLETESGVVLFDHRVPLNGEWSDLTAQFEFHPRGQRWAVILEDLHVL